MNLEKLKDLIEKQSKVTFPIIFLDSENSFVADQYANAISVNMKLPLLTTSSVLNISPESIMFEEAPSCVYYVHQHKLEENDIPHILSNNLIIISTDCMDENTFEQLRDYVVAVPKLEDWQIKDYIYAQLTGADKKDIDKLLTLCKNDIYRLNNEVSKLKLFEGTQQKNLLQELFREDAFEDISNATIFDFSNAIQSRDLDSLRELLPTIARNDVEPLGLVTILYNNFRKMIQVWMDNNPTPESTGLKSNQIWAIKNIPHNYSKDQLISIFEMLTCMEKKLKTGELEEKYIVDYLITTILSI